MPGTKTHRSGSLARLLTISISPENSTMAKHPNDSSDDSFARDIERAWLIRGEEKKVSQARGIATLIFGAIVIVAIIAAFIGQALGIEVKDMIFILAVLVVCSFGCYYTWPKG